VSFKESRFAVALVLVPVLYLMIQTAPSPLFFLLTTIAILRVQYEFYALFFSKREQGPVYVGLGLGALFAYFYPQHQLIPSVIFYGTATLFIMVVFIYQLFSFQEIKTTLTDSAVILLGVAYIVGFLGHLILIRLMDHGPMLVIFLLLITWVGDAGAYYVGRAIGKRKLYPKVSPNKTVEGAIGGLMASLLTGLLAKASFLTLFSWGEMITLSLLLGILGQLGDLTESMFKRSAGVKDASSIIPAHGGLYDKLDSIAFTAPAFYYYLSCIEWYRRLPVGY